MKDTRKKKGIVCELILRPPNWKERLKLSLSVLLFGRATVVVRKGPIVKALKNET